MVLYLYSIVKSNQNTNVFSYYSIFVKMIVSMLVCIIFTLRSIFYRLNTLACSSDDEQLFITLSSLQDEGIMNNIVADQDNELILVVGGFSNEASGSGDYSEILIWIVFMITVRIIFYLICKYAVIEERLNDMQASKKELDAKYESGEISSDEYSAGVKELEEALAKLLKEHQIDGTFFNSASSSSGTDDF